MDKVQVKHLPVDRIVKAIQYGNTSYIRGKHKASAYHTVV